MSAFTGCCFSGDDLSLAGGDFDSSGRSGAVMVGFGLTMGNDRPEEDLEKPSGFGASP